MGADVYEERINALSARRLDVQTERITLAERRAALIREGKPTGDLWVQINGMDRELSELDRELSELSNLAAGKWAAERHRADRVDFAAGNRSLAAKRGALPRMRREAIEAVAAAGEKFRQFVNELDAQEREMAERAAALNATAAALREPADFVVPAALEPVIESRAAGIALTRVVQTARHGDRQVFLRAVADAVFVLG